MMTRKHYKAIASILNKYKRSLDSDMMSALCIYFTSDNENFNHQKFLEVVYDGS